MNYLQHIYIYILLLPLDRHTSQHFSGAYLHTIYTNQLSLKLPPPLHEHSFQSKTQGML